jgi:hypothetical protein
MDSSSQGRAARRSSQGEFGVLSLANLVLLVWLHRRARRNENLVDPTDFLARRRRPLVINRPDEGVSSRLRICSSSAGHLLRRTFLINDAVPR